MKVKQSHFKPGQALRVSEGWGSQILWQSAHEGGKVVSLTHRPPSPPENICSTHFCYSHGAAGRIMSMKNSNDTIMYQTHDLLACSAVLLVQVHTICTICITLWSLEFIYIIFEHSDPNKPITYCISWGVRFSQWCCLRFMSPGMWCTITSQAK